MSIVPAEIAGLGSSSMKLRVSPGFDPLKAQVGPDEYFVLSRIDGTQTIREVLLSTGLPIERGVAIVLRLRSIGALLLPGETSTPIPAAAPARPAQPRMPSNTPVAPVTPARGVPIDIGRGAAARTPIPAPPAAKMPARVPPAADLEPPTHPRHVLDQATSRNFLQHRPPAADPAALDGPTVQRAPSFELDIVLPAATDAERKALAEPCDLGADERVRILAMARLVASKDPYALLGVPDGAAAKELKRAYFKLSKDFHPDRFYGRRLGSFAERLTVIFEAISRAYGRLTSPDKDRRTGAYAAVGAEQQPQTPTEYAAELFERACGLEVGGDALGAMKLFAAAVRIDPQTRYLRRAATCALAAEQPKTALEYAKKAQAQAPSDPSSARLLAFAFKANGRYSDAEEVLVMAMALKSENDVLTAELRNDLAEVRRLLSG